MTTDELPQRWADQFGLASVPLFGTKEVAAEGCHAVLLDGGYGSFAIAQPPKNSGETKKPPIGRGQAICPIM